MAGHGTYLDTNVLLDMAVALDGEWQPPPELDKTNRQYLAAARVWFYGYQDRSGWFLTTSTLGVAEAIERAGWDWVTGFIDQVDSHGDAPAHEVVQDVAGRFRDDLGLGMPDAVHLAHVELRPWMGRLVTSDRKFLTKARGATLSHQVEFMSVIEAELALGIKPGETPPIRPERESPLWGHAPWWIPAVVPPTAESRE